MKPFDELRSDLLANPHITNAMNDIEHQIAYEFFDFDAKDADILFDKIRVLAFKAYKIGVVEVEKRQARGDYNRGFFESGNATTNDTVDIDSQGSLYYTGPLTEENIDITIMLPGSDPDGILVIEPLS